MSMGSDLTYDNSVYTYKYFRAVYEWELGNYCRYSYTYDLSGNCITRQYETWVNGNWQNLWLVLTTYNISGKIVSDVEQNMDKCGWINSNMFYLYLW